MKMNKCPKDWQVIISMFIREQDPALLASADFARSAAEKTADEEVISASLCQFSPKLHVGDLQTLARTRRQEAEKAQNKSKDGGNKQAQQVMTFSFILSDLAYISDSVEPSC